MAEGGSRNVKEKLAKLKTEEQVVAKSCRASLNSIKLCDKRLAADISIVAGELEEARRCEKYKINGDVAEIYEAISEFQNTLKKDEALLEFSPKTCRKKLLHIQNKIVQSRQYLEKEIFVLKNEEKALFDEIILAQKRIEEGPKYDQHLIKPIHKFANAKISSTSHSEKDKDIEEFEKYVETHGHTGGWDEQDHLLFLRLRGKFQNHNQQSKLISALTNQLPDLSSSKISEHIKWFENYESLREKNKIAIQKWRDAKKKIKKTEREGSSTRRTSSVTSCESSESMQKKIEISEWKKQKKLLVEQVEQKKKTEEEANKKRQKLEREKQVRVKEQVEVQRRRREEAEMLAKMEQKMFDQEIRKERAKEATKMIKTYRKLDELHTERLKLLRIKKQEKKELPQVHETIFAERDPDRLMQLTQVWRARCKVEDEEEKPIFAQPPLHLKNIQHLGIPNWRRGINS